VIVKPVLRHLGKDEPLLFEMDRLLTYDGASILAEIQCVAGLIGSPVISRTALDKHSRVASSTVIRRHGGWFEALQASGVEDRYGGRSVSPKMRDQRGRSCCRLRT
jgi:hypothetical protein